MQDGIDNLNVNSNTNVNTNTNSNANTQTMIVNMPPQMSPGNYVQPHTGHTQPQSPPMQYNEAANYHYGAYQYAAPHHMNDGFSEPSPPGFPMQMPSSSAPPQLRLPPAPPQLHGFKSLNSSNERPAPLPMVGYAPEDYRQPHTDDNKIG